MAAMLIKNVDVEMDERVMAQLLALPYRLDMDDEGHVVMTPLEAPGLTWEQLATTHPILPAALSWRVETDARNRLIMSPPPISDHQEYESEIFTLLVRLMPGGRVLCECGVQTSNGTRIPDIIWISKERRRANNRRPSLKPAPEICVEVISESNTRREIDEKATLYFEAGTLEVWRCERNGNVSFYTSTGQIERSLLCPDFPLRLDPFA